MNNNGNGSRPKVDPQLGEEVRLKLLRDQPHIGQNNFGQFYMYTVQDLDDGKEKVLFAPNYIHNVIAEKKLGAGSEFLLKKVATQNGGKKLGSKLELSLVKASEEQPKTNSNGTDKFKEIMQQSLLDAIEITKSMKEVPFQAEDLRSICSCLFIARTRANGYTS